MKKADAIIQGLLLLAAIVFLLTAFFIKDTLFYLFIYTCFFTCWWQIFSAMSLLSHADHYSRRTYKTGKAFFLLMLLFFAGIALGLATAHWVSILSMACSSLLIPLYFVFTCRIAFAKPRRKTFMDII